MNRIMRSGYSNLLAFLISAFNLTKEEIQPSLFDEI